MFDHGPKHRPKGTPPLQGLEGWLLSFSESADVITNGRQLKQYHPNSVMNVVSGADLADRGICQNPEFASGLEKTQAPEVAHGQPVVAHGPVLKLVNCTVALEVALCDVGD